MGMKIKEIIYFNKKGILSFILIILVLVGGVFAFIITSPKNKVEADEEIVLTDIKDEKKINKKKEINEDKKEECYIDIKGSVKKEGVYKLDCNSRVNDAINKAGGVTKNADTSIINLSKKITDGMVIKVYSKLEVSNFLKTFEKEEKLKELCTNNQIKNDACIDNKEKTNSINNSTNKKIININTSTMEELMTLDGIGESKAKAIIEYRNKNPFKSIEEIKNIPGIGENMYVKIKENITI